MSRQLLPRLFCGLLLLVLWPVPAPAGPYADSAHGDAAYGVRRVSIDALGYVRGNCGHCHEQHAGIGGVEPAPAGGQPSPFTLFADNFSGQSTNPYNQADDFCFYCHAFSGSVQVGGIVNYPYSRTFGGAVTGTISGILGAFNQRSYHNLEDIRNFSSGRFTFFKTVSNPCVACHNPHRARRNRANPRDPAYSAISRPTDHESLVTASMADSFGSEYEPPFCSGSYREPANSVSADAGRAATPDYVAFCISCHNYQPFSTLYNRNLQTINWSGSGDKHGMRDRTDSSPSATAALPYNVNSDYLLSCLDCHEPHGSDNVMLIRTRVNGGPLNGAVTSPVVVPPTVAYGSNSQLGYLCLRCHLSDSTGSNSWQQIHHTLPDAPYRGARRCRTCHGSRHDPIDCGKCHYHGGSDSWLNDKRPDMMTGRRTF